MPTQNLRACSYPGCPTLVERGRCDHHSGEYAKRAARKLYGTKEWKEGSKQFLREHPLCQCEKCQAGKLKVTAATVVDHVIPHNGNPGLFWSRSNWRAMSKPHHDSKTAGETNEKRRQWSIA